jgi:hypothetical protein
MKNIRHIIFLCLITLLFGCDNSSNKSTIENKTVKPSVDSFDGGETSCVYAKTTKKLSETFPFNVADKIEVVSYTCRTCAKDYHDSDSLIVDNKFIVKNTQDKVTLTKSQIDSLFSILYNYKMKRKGNFVYEAACYMPRHSIVFYKNQKPISFLEICFECFNYRQTKNVDFGEFCDAKYCDLYKFFKSIGIKNGLIDEYCE